MLLAMKSATLTCIVSILRHALRAHLYQTGYSRDCEVVNTHWQDSPRSVLDIYKELISLGLRIWILSGDTDAVIPVTSTRYSINALNLPTVSHWRAWYDSGQVVCSFSL